jgi:uncharacterized protein YpiB (UPF0302 family)
MKPTDITTKQQFIHYLLCNYEASDRGRIALLTYLMNHPSLLKKVYFVDSSRPFEHSMRIVMNRCQDNTFYYKRVGKQLIKNSTEALNELISSSTKEEMPNLYIEVRYRKYLDCPHYHSVVDKTFTNDMPITTKLDKNEAEELHEQIITNQLNAKIDQSLEEKDEKMFKRLTHMLITKKYLKADRK